MLLEEKDPRNLTLRILVVNVSAIHTTSMVSRFFLTYIQFMVNFPVETFVIAFVPIAGLVSQGCQTIQCSHGEC